MLAAVAFQAPYRTFDRFAVKDSGAELAIQDMLRRGLRPGVDFGYPYGLLGLLAGRAYYAVAPLSPAAYHAEVVACALLTAWGLARFTAARRPGPAGIALVVLAVPDLLLVIYITATQALEQTLLVHALAEQARGRRPLALALAAACWFVKPSLAALVGLALVVGITADRLRAGPRAWLRALAPAALTALGLAGLLAAAFGPAALAATFLPGTARAVYRLNGYGFFRAAGRTFWALPNARPLDYFRYETGYYLLGTALLAGGGLAALARLSGRGGGSGDARDDEVVATCAAAHVGFILLFFGHRNTWFYSLPMLVLGLAAFGRRGRWQAGAVALLALLVLVSDRSKAVEVARRWRTHTADAVTAGLWAAPEERADWAEVRRFTRGGGAAFFSHCEGGDLLLPGFPRPTSAYLIPGLPVPAELRRKAAQLSRARWIVSARSAHWDPLASWPDLAAAFDGCEPVYQGRSLQVYRRVRAPTVPDPNPRSATRAGP